MERQVYPQSNFDGFATEKLYRQIVEMAQEGIWVVDQNSKTTFVNKKLCELLEYTAEEMIGRTIGQFQDDEGKSLSNVGLAERRLGKAGNLQMKYITKSGKEIWADISASPLYDDEGIYKGAMALITDISEKRKIQKENERLGYVASLTRHGVAYHDMNACITWVNNAFERLTGYPAAEVVGKNPAFLFGPATDPATLDELRRCRKEGKHGHFDIVNYTKSGKAVWFELEMVPLFEHGLQTGFITIFQDINDRKNSNEEHLNLIDRLQKRNSDLQQFSYIVSHNLRAPVANMLGLTTLIKPHDEENEQLVRMLAEEARGLDDVITDINLIISARKTDAERIERLSLSAEIEHLKQMLRTEIDMTDARVTFDISGANEVHTIKSYLYSVLYNLVANSIKYRSRIRRCEILISTQAADKGVVISVRDNGMGINLEKYGSRIFGLYKRFHGKDFPGKGVGLHLVKTHVESMGGKIEIESTVDVGTEFKIYLPDQHAG